MMMPRNFDLNVFKTKEHHLVPSYGLHFFALSSSYTKQHCTPGSSVLGADQEQKRGVAGSGLICETLWIRFTKPCKILLNVRK